jgi:murein DD-endopeptidase MepM/ murein hydrolase activator NlpD
MWIQKIILLMMVFALCGCSQPENSREESIIPDISVREVEAKSVIDQALILTPDTAIPTVVLSKLAYRQTPFVLGRDTPIPGAQLDKSIQICSPLATVPIEHLSSIVSDPYNPPPMGKDDRHQGVDFAYYRQFGRASIAGEGVQSVFEGKIAGVVDNKFPFGNALIVETPYEQLSVEIQEIIGIKSTQSLYALYAHMEYLGVNEIGQKIDPCQSIGAVGKSGNAGVEHLHLDMRLGPPNQIISSMSYYVSEATSAERETYRLWRTSGDFIHFDPMELLDIEP